MNVASEKQKGLHLGVLLFIPHKKRNAVTGRGGAWLYLALWVLGEVGGWEVGGEVKVKCNPPMVKQESLHLRTYTAGLPWVKSNKMCSF